MEGRGGQGEKQETRGMLGRSKERKRKRKKERGRGETEKQGSRHGDEDGKAIRGQEGEARG